MDMNKATALTLRLGVVAGLILVVAGLLSGETVLWAGILVLILSPFLGVIVTFLFLLKERDKFWTMVAGLLLIITATGALLSM